MIARDARRVHKRVTVFLMAVLSEDRGPGDGDLGPVRPSEDGPVLDGGAIAPDNRLAGPAAHQVLLAEGPAHALQRRRGLRDGCDRCSAEGAYRAAISSAFRAGQPCSQASIHSLAAIEASTERILWGSTVRTSPLIEEHKCLPRFLRLSG